MTTTFDNFRTTGRTESGQAVSEFEAPDLSPKEYAEHYSGVVANALEGTDLVEIVEVQAAVGQIHLLGRVKQENERNLVHGVVDNILAKCSGSCDIHICKHFFRKNKKLVYGWVFSFSGADLKTAATDICGAIDEVVPRKEVLEAPLLGQKPLQGGAGKRGARPVVAGR